MKEREKFSFSIHLYMDQLLNSTVLHLCVCDGARRYQKQAQKRSAAKLFYLHSLLVFLFLLRCDVYLPLRAKKPMKALFAPRGVGNTQLGSKCIQHMDIRVYVRASWCCYTCVCIYVCRNRVNLYDM